MAGQCQGQLVAGNAATIVGDANELDAAFFQMHLNGLAAGIEAVFQQFLEHRGGAFDHFAGGNLADQEVGEAGDFWKMGWHARIIMPPCLFSDRNACLALLLTGYHCCCCLPC